VVQVQVIFQLRYVSNGHVFVFRWTEATRQGLLRELGRQAADLANPFTWYNAAVVSKKVREMDAGGVVA
jgi:hypothetical protein